MKRAEMRSRAKVISLAVGMAASLMLAACGGGSSGGGGQTANGRITGVVVKGPLNGGTVSAYQLSSSLVRGSLLGQGTTAADGSFSIAIPPYNGMVEVVATGGTYPEEARRDSNGDPIPLNLTAELSAIVPSFTSGGSATTTVTPISTIARWLAKAHVGTSDAATAIASAWTCVNNHFGNGAVDWRTVVPTNFALAHGQTINVSAGDPAVQAGLMLAALSQAARTMAADTSVTGATLTAALAEDAKDGQLDGKLNGASLNAGSTGSPIIDSYLTRRLLGQAVLDFVTSGANPAAAQLTTTAVYPLASALAGDAATCLFPAADAPVPLALTPPALTFTDAGGAPAAPPQYTNQSTLTLYATATDALSSVTAVFAQSGSTLVTGTFAGGVWTLPGIPLNANAANTIYVWGVDALGSGSITGSGTQTVKVVQDAQGPTFFPDVVTTTYYDERQVALADATVPPVYVFPADAAKNPVAPNTPIYKASSRLRASAPASAAVLEGSNPDNLPYVRFAIPVTAGEAPISSVTYAINDGTTTYTGNLLAPPPSTDPSWLSTTTATSEVFVLPLSADFVPSLATTTTNPIHLTVSVTAADAAGNIGGPVSLGTYTFNVVGPPIVVQEDTAFSTYSDTRSVYPYRVSDQSYTPLWSDSTRFPGSSVRLIRYVLLNPTAVPVAVDASFLGNATASEVWTRVLATPALTSNVLDSGGNPTPYYGADGFTYLLNEWIANNGSPIEGCAQTTTAVHWIGSGTRIDCADSTSMPWGVLADHYWSLSQQWLTPYSGTSNFVWTQSAAVSSIAFNASETTAPLRVSGLPVIPPASAGSPGQIVMYLARPYAGRGLAATVYTGILDALVYRWDDVRSGGSSGYRVYDLYNEYRHLTSAAEALNGTTTMNTTGVVGTSLIGTGAPRFSTTYSNVTLTTH